DRLLLVVGTINAIDGVNLRFGKRTITQVHSGQTEVARRPLTYGHGLINAMQQNDERIVGAMFVIGHCSPRGCKQSGQRPADERSSVFVDWGWFAKLRLLDCGFVPKHNRVSFLDRGFRPEFPFWPPGLAQYTAVASI